MNCSGRNETAVMAAIHTIQSRQGQHDMPRVTSSAVGAVVSSLRMHQWIKNSLLFAAIVFAGEITDLPKLATAIAGFAVFCLLSSGVYLFNDIADRNNDRQHPLKRHRPLASGQLSPAIAATVCLLLLTAGIVGGFSIGYAFGCLVCIYVGQNILYSMVLKQVAILDVDGAGHGLRSARGRGRGGHFQYGLPLAGNLQPDAVSVRGLRKAAT